MLTIRRIIPQGDFTEQTPFSSLLYKYPMVIYPERHRLFFILYCVKVSLLYQLATFELIKRYIFIIYARGDKWLTSEREKKVEKNIKPVMQ